MTVYSGSIAGRQREKFLGQLIRIFCRFGIGPGCQGQQGAIRPRDEMDLSTGRFLILTYLPGSRGHTTPDLTLRWVVRAAGIGRGEGRADCEGGNDASAVE
jgi:hypothetical protein